MAKLVYPELSYLLMGLFYKIHNELGPSYQEKHYQRAIELKLKKNDLKYTREKAIELPYEDGSLGKFYADFIIEDKIIIEVKKSKFIIQENTRQLYRYLKATGLRLGLIINFGRQGKLQYKRIINLWLFELN